MMRRYSMPFFAVTVLGALLASSIPALAQEAPAEAAPATSEPADSAHADTEGEARAIATAYDHDVVVDSQSSPTLLIKARPDGYMEATSSQAPEQAEVKGEWKKVDTALVEKDGWFEPKVAAVGVKVSAGGTDELVKVRTETGEWVTEVWPYGTLPAPKVSKSAAVFGEVLPGVDLRVSVTKTGMREVLVVKNQAAAADPRLASLKFRIKDATLSVHPETGTLAASPLDGTPVVASTPLWWDSSGDRANAESPGDSEPKAVDVQAVSATESVLDVQSVTDGDIQYPLYVDPDWGAYLQYDWYTDRAYPNQSYLNPPENSAGYGIQSGTGYLSRAFYRFDTAFLAGKLVQNARFNVVQTWANSCASTWMQLWQYGQSGVGFTWNSDPAQWNRPIDAQPYNTGGSCSPNPAWVGFSATPAIQDAANAGAGYQTLALRAADEGNSLTRKHYRWDAQLIVTYNSRPNTPVNLAMTSPNRGCSTDSANPSFVNASAGVTLKVNVTDPDAGQNTAANFYVKKLSDGSVKAYSSTFQQQGADLTRAIPAADLAQNERYAWQARGSDNIQDSAAFSAWCYFTTDATKPALPTITIDPTGARVGSALSATITPPANDNIAGYQVWWTKGAKTDTSPAAPVTNYTTSVPSCAAGAGGAVRVVCASANGTATIDVAPIDRLSTLWIAAYDKAGNVSFNTATSSAAAGVEVTADAADMSAGHVWNADSAGATAFTDRVGTSNITIGGNAGWDTAAAEDPPLRFQGMTMLNRYIKPGVNHKTETDSGLVPGYNLEYKMGLIARYGAGSPQPANTWTLYACNYGSGNMLSRSANCEGTNVASRPLGYSWISAADVPSGYPSIEIFRCRTGVDYFISTNTTCEGQVNEGSRGFIIVPNPALTTSPDGIVDTTKSFTVSARVKPTGNTAAQTYVSASGAANSGFYLQAADGVWRFCVRAQGPTVTTGCVDGPTIDYSAGFVTVSGVWDAVNRQVRIGVVSVGVQTFTSSTYTPPADDKKATGAIVLGSAVSAGLASDYFDGRIADVSFYQTALPDSALIAYPVPQP